MTKARDIASAAPAPSTVSATEIGYLDGVTSAIQTQIDGKQAANANVSTTELGYLDGVTSAIQTQLDGKTAKSTLTTTGDIYYASSANTPARLGIGSTGQVLTVASGIPSWAAAASGGMTLLSTTSLSGTSTSVSITGTGYVGLYITVSDMSVTQAGQMYFRLNSDSGSNQYRWTGTFLDGATNALSSGVNTAVVQSFNAETTQTDMYWNIQIFNSEDTATYKAGRWMTMQNRYSDNRIELEGGIFSYQSTSAITNFTLFTGTAGTFSAGSIKVYGVK